MLVAESGNSNQANQLLRVQIPENTADLRGMRFEEAMQELETRIHECPNNSVLFVVHGHGTGQLKSGVQKHLKHHVLVKKFEFESKSAGGCTVVELKWLVLHVAKTVLASERDKSQAVYFAYLVHLWGNQIVDCYDVRRSTLYRYISRCIDVLAHKSMAGSVQLEDHESEVFVYTYLV